MNRIRKSGKRREEKRNRMKIRYDERRVEAGGSKEGRRGGRMVKEEKRRNRKGEGRNAETFKER